MFDAESPASCGLTAPGELRAGMCHWSFITGSVVMTLSAAKIGQSLNRFVLVFTCTNRSELFSQILLVAIIYSLAFISHTYGCGYPTPLMTTQNDQSLVVNVEPFRRDPRRPVRRGKPGRTRRRCARHVVFLRRGDRCRWLCQRWFLVFHGLLMVS